MRRYTTILFLLWLVSAGRIQAAAAVVFLEIYPDARTTALGNSGVAASNLDANVYYNPAALGWSPRIAATWSQADWLPGLYPGMGYEYGAASYRLRHDLGLGASWTYLNTGKVDVTNSAGQYLGSYTPFEMAPCVSIGYQFLPWLSFGASAKYIYSLLVPEWVWELMPELGIEHGGTGTSVGFDFGSQFRPVEWFGLGVSVSNIGPVISYTSEGSGNWLPSTLRAGFQLGPKTDWPVEPSLTGDLALVRPDVPRPDSLSFEYDHWKSLGLEFRFARVASLRLGYFEDISGQRGGILVQRGDETQHIGLLRYLQNPHGYQTVYHWRDFPWNLCWGVGLEFNGLALDVGVDQGIYDFPTHNIRFQLSYRL